MLILGGIIVHETRLKWGWKPHKLESQAHSKSIRAAGSSVGTVNTDIERLAVCLICKLYDENIDLRVRSSDIPHCHRQHYHIYIYNSRLFLRFKGAGISAHRLICRL